MKREAPPEAGGASMLMKKDKLRDMIRSVLPSTKRETARLIKAAESRRVRRSVRSDLRSDSLDNLRRNADQSENVSWRRAGDKLNHFMRWCEAITAGMDTQEALDRVRALLPRDVIGDHAYSHWERHRRCHCRKWIGIAEFTRRNDQSIFDSMRFRLRRALAVDPTLHTRLNAEIKHRKLQAEPRRLLMGNHDVDAFIGVVWFQEGFETEQSTTLELIERIEKTKGGRKAALGVLDYAAARSQIASPFSGAIS